MADKFLTDLGIADLREMIDTGFNTAESFFDKQVQPRRKAVSTGRYENFGGPVALVTIDFGLREVSSSMGVPIETRSSDGDVRFNASEYEPINGDRFTHEGMVCEISAVYPVEYDRIRCEVKLIQGEP